MTKKEYTIGLDIGTNSVGWAAIDDAFNLAQGKKRIVEKDFSKDSTKTNPNCKMKLATSGKKFSH